MISCLSRRNFQVDRLIQIISAAGAFMSNAKEGIIDADDLRLIRQVFEMRRKHDILGPIHWIVIRGHPLGHIAALINIRGFQAENGKPARRALGLVLRHITANIE